MADHDLLDELRSDRDIRAVLVRYCRGIDRMDAELTLSCWHPDGTADYGRLYEGSAQGFVEWLWPVHAAMVGHVHTLGNVTVELDGDRAATEAYVCVVLRFVHDDGQQYDLVGRGRYLDAFERRHGHWAIAHRRYVSDLGTIQKVEGFDVSRHLPPVRPGLRPLVGRRDHDDLSYTLLRR
jgi:hypothetical protein